MGQLEHWDTSFWSRRDVDAVFGCQGLHFSKGKGQGNGMQLSLCVRVVLASKPDGKKQFL